ncbi:hypothetical protein MRX96_042283 [Rhipicephalus microplus]
MHQRPSLKYHASPSAVRPARHVSCPPPAAQYRMWLLAEVHLFLHASTAPPRPVPIHVRAFLRGALPTPSSETPLDTTPSSSSHYQNHARSLKGKIEAR